MIAQAELNAEDIRDTVQEVAQAHLPLHADGYQSSSEMLYDVLLKASIERISIEAVCNDLEQTVGGNQIREMVNEQLSAKQLREHEREINDALVARMPKQIWEKRLAAALDEHDEPFYGKTPTLCAHTVRSRAKNGTTHFFRIISLYVMYRQMRLTVAVAFVLPEDETVAIIDRLYQRVKRLGLRLRVLYLDRGYCSGAVIRYLQAHKQPSVLACTIRGKTGGTRQLGRGRKSYRTPYTFTDGTTVDMAVVLTMPKGKNQKQRRKWLLFVTIGLNWTPQQVYQNYRSRFGIETSYRILRRVRAKTTSPNPALRFFILGFSLLLVNLWTFLRWSVARIPGPGPHRIAPTLFQFHTFTCLLRRVIESLWGCHMRIPYTTYLKS